MTTPFEKIGADALRSLIADFYDRVFRDVMIGFMFQGKDKKHLIDREWELIAALLGAPGVKYTGRPMRTAHAQHTIFGGHFERRLQILREAMRDHAVDAEVQQVWIDHTQSLRAQITRDKGSECATTAETAPKLAIVPDAPDLPPDKPIKLGRR
ncbi:MAG: group 1 truncated hemoglobin [Deltaproteobacteria bacterium]|nr:group 1 truncated hemoglobin [Deltaproteobacteria bacterium]